MMALPSSSS